MVAKEGMVINMEFGGLQLMIELAMEDLVLRDIPSGKSACPHLFIIQVYFYLLWLETFRWKITLVIMFSYTR